jgi:hypothetical protein
VTERLQYVAQALPLIKSELGDQTALLGFAGSPWTLANFMIEGGSAKEYTKAKALFYSDPQLFYRLLEKLTAAVTEFLQMQIDARVDAVQIFDSLGGCLADNAFEAASASWIRRIIRSLNGACRSSFFQRNTRELDASPRRRPGHRVDWTVLLAGVQPACRPSLACREISILSAEHPPGDRFARSDASARRDAGRKGHIFNLARRSTDSQTGVHRKSRRHCPQLQIMSALDLDLGLIQKYSVPGPRYTSYPPATQFSDQVPTERVLEKIRANNETERDVSLYFHLPFCQSLCWYCGCTTVITTQQSQSATYLKYLEKEVNLMAKLLHPKRKVGQLHFGGGTPTFFLPQEIRALGQLIRSRFNVAPDVEAGVEIDPRRLTHEHVDALREAGFNRASIGVQDHNPAVQLAVHRIQPFAQTKMVVNWIRQAGFKSINLDLIYGLPHQTPASFEKTLDEVLFLRPDRFAIFNYAHVPWIKPGSAFSKRKPCLRRNEVANSPTHHPRSWPLKATSTSAWITLPGPTTNCRRPTSEILATKLSATAPAAALTFTPSACRPSRRPTVSTGRTTSNCRTITPTLTRAGTRSLGVTC